MEAIITAFENKLTEIDSDLVTLNGFSDENYNTDKLIYISKYQELLDAINFDSESERTTFIGVLTNIRAHVNSLLATFLIL